MGDCDERQHTPIVSRAQAGLFGAELNRLRSGKKTKSGMDEATLARHLKESAGKNLPERINKFIEKQKKNPEREAAKAQEVYNRVIDSAFKIRRKK
jgi:hypothetical protein